MDQQQDLVKSSVNTYVDSKKISTDKKTIPSGNDNKSDGILESTESLPKKSTQLKSSTTADEPKDSSTVDNEKRPSSSFAAMIKATSVTDTTGLLLKIANTDDQQTKTGDTNPPSSKDVKKTSQEPIIKLAKKSTGRFSCKRNGGSIGITNKSKLTCCP